jgi:hypothetical protein
VFTFTAVIHSARSSGGKLLHSRRTDGFEHGGELFEVTDRMSRVTAARTRPTIREMDIPRARDVPYGGGQERETGGRDGETGSARLIHMLVGIWSVPVFRFSKAAMIEPKSRKLVG